MELRGRSVAHVLSGYQAAGPDLPNVVATGADADDSRCGGALGALAVFPGPHHTLVAMLQCLLEERVRPPPGARCQAGGRLVAEAHRATTRPDPTN